MPMNLTPAEELGNPKLIKLEENLMFAKQKRYEQKNTKLLHLALLERLINGILWGRLLGGPKDHSHDHDFGHGQDHG